MQRFAILIGAVVLALTTVQSAQQPDRLKAAADTLGVERIKTLRFTASGATFSVGQNFKSGDPWPKVALTSYTVLIDFDAGSMRQELQREMGLMMPRGGGVPFSGELRQIQYNNPYSVWNIPVPPDPSASALPTLPCTPPEDGGTAALAVPAPDSQVPCALMIWSTPQGFLKAARAHRATTAPTPNGTAVSFAIDGHAIKGVIDTQYHIVRVETSIDQSIIGDMNVETEYSDYQNFGGVQFPSHIVQKQDGFPSLDLTVTAVATNQSAIVRPPPEATKEASQFATGVKVQEVANGVFWLTGGTHHSLAIAMRDYIIVVDTPNGEARASAVLTKAKELIPGKPIRYVITTHHHWDHLGGIRTAIDEGATIVTHETNRAFFERLAWASHTIRPDRLAASKKPLKLQTIGNEGTLADGSRTVKLYTMTGFDHAIDMLMVYLPEEKVLAEADAYTPPDLPNTPVIAPKAAYAASLYDNIQRLNLDVQVIVPFHGTRTADLSEVRRQAQPAVKGDLQ